MTIATTDGGRQRTSTDGLSQATHAAPLVVSTRTWVRDEKAAASGVSVLEGVKPAVLILNSVQLDVQQQLHDPVTCSAADAASYLPSTPGSRMCQ